MDITHYLFAFFVFLLVAACIWLFGRVARKKSKEEPGTYEKEQRLFTLYQNLEDMMNSFEEYVGETKAEIDKRLQALKKAAQTQDGAQAAVREDAARRIETDAAQPAPVSHIKEAAAKLQGIPESMRDLPVEEAIPMLFEQGYEGEQIAKFLGISNREVTLTMGIKKMNGEKNIH